MTATTPERKLARLPRECLHPDPNQPRKDFAQDRLLELAASLRNVGQQQPLLVWECPGQLPQGHFRLGDGERRWRAAPFVPLDALDCVILPVPADQHQMLTIQLSLGATNEKLSPFELAEGAAELMRAKGMTQEDVADLLGISPSKLSKAMAIKDHLAPELRPDVDAGRIPFTTAAALARLRNNVPLQRELAGKILAGLLKRDAAEKAVVAALGKGKAKARPLRLKFAGMQLLVPEASAERLQAFLDSVGAALRKVSKESLPLDVLPALLGKG